MLQKASSSNQHIIALLKFKMYVKYRCSFGETLILLQFAIYIYIAKTGVIF